MSPEAPKSLNLEVWASKALSSQEHQHLRLFPNGLGRVLFIKRFLGDSDVKLANIITVDDLNLNCYGIDNESCGIKSYPISYSVDDLLASISEYSPSDNLELDLAQHISDIDLRFQNPHKQLLDEPELLYNIRETLNTSIRSDIDEGTLDEVLERAASMTDETLLEIVNGFGSLLTIEEKNDYLDRFKQLRQIALDEIEEHRSQNTLSP